MLFNTTDNQPTYHYNTDVTNLETDNKGINLYNASKYFIHIYADRTQDPVRFKGTLSQLSPTPCNTICTSRGTDKRTLHNWWRISGHQVSTQQ